MADTEDLDEEFNERAAIIEYDGGLSHIDAYYMALDIVSKKRGMTAGEVEVALNLF